MNDDDRVMLCCEVELVSECVLECGWVRVSGAVSDGSGSGSSEVRVSSGTCDSVDVTVCDSRVSAVDVSGCEKKDRVSVSDRDSGSDDSDGANSLRVCRNASSDGVTSSSGKIAAETSREAVVGVRLCNRVRD